MAVSVSTTTSKWYFKTLTISQKTEKKSQRNCDSHLEILQPFQGIKFKPFKIFVNDKVKLKSYPLQFYDLLSIFSHNKHCQLAISYNFNYNAAFCHKTISEWNPQFWFTVKYYNVSQTNSILLTKCPIVITEQQGTRRAMGNPSQGYWK